MKIFRLPDLGEGLAEAEIREWHVKEGDEVKVDQPMLAVETDKAIVEVPAPRAGKIYKLYGKPGEMMKVGAPLVEFEDGDDAVEKKADAGTVAGRVEVGNTIIDEPAEGLRTAKQTQRIKAMPAVRVLARKLNVDLTTVQGSGPGGQITSQDVEQAQQKNLQPPAGYTPLHGARRAMVNTMTLSHREVVPVTLMDDADIYAWHKDTDIMVRIVRALVVGCQQEPSLNAWYDGKTLSRRLMQSIDIGIAVDSEEGLLVPVLKDAANKDFKSWRETIDRFKQEVKTRTIPGEDLRGATIMLSNFGSFAGRYANPILVPPVVAILGTGKVREEVVANQGKMEIHRILPLSLTIDHRAVTGGEATRFLKAVMTDLAYPE